MLWVLKGTVSTRRFFWAPKRYAKITGKNYLQFYAEHFCLPKPVQFVCVIVSLPLEVTKCWYVICDCDRFLDHIHIFLHWLGFHSDSVVEFDWVMICVLDIARIASNVCPISKQSHAAQVCFRLRKGKHHDSKCRLSDLNSKRCR